MVFMLVSVSLAWSDNINDALLSCLLEPSQVVQLSSKVPGVVRSFDVERGDKVSKGQIIFSLESAVEKSAYITAQAKVEFASRNLQRNQNLIDKNLLSGFEIDEIRTEKLLAELEMKEARTLMNERIVYSPIDAIVVEREASVGEYVGSEPVVKLVALNPLYVEIVMRSDVYGQLKKDMKVLVQPEGDVNNYSASIMIVDQIIDAASGTFGVRLKLDNSDFKLPAGLKCQADFIF
jgi:RND family efflux transporter MFP subunit